MRTLFRFIKTLCFAAFLILPTRALGTDTIVAVTDYWPPFRIQSEEGITGIDMDLLAIIGKRLGVEIVVEKMPWARCLLSIKEGSADLMTGVAKTPEREEYMLFTSMPYYACAPAFYERKSRQGTPIKRYDDLYEVEIGFTRDSAYFARFDEDENLDKFPANNEKQLLKMTDDSRLDVFIGTDCQVDYDIARLDLADTIRKAPYQPESRIDLFIGVSMESPLADRMDEINAILRDLGRRGRIRLIASEYVKMKP